MIFLSSSHPCCRSSNSTSKDFSSSKCIHRSSNKDTRNSQDIRNNNKDMRNNSEDMQAVPTEEPFGEWRMR